MKRMCAWCGKYLGEQETEEQEVITHGVCEDCAHHLFAQMGMPLSEYLDGLRAPVMVIDPQGVVKTANRQARTLLGKEPSEIEGLRGGDVFECAYAHLPGGCGETVHCSGCTIRRAVMDTLSTGQSRLRTPAYLNRETPERIQQISFLISTEQVQEIVLLRIDAVAGQELSEAAGDDRTEHS